MKASWTAVFGDYIGLEIAENDIEFGVNGLESIAEVRGCLECVGCECSELVKN